ncbi:MAG TPA: hypothetical protein VFZ18_08285, partial [Longimicrobiaceae bacterium]
MKGGVTLRRRAVAAALVLLVSATGFTLRAGLADREGNSITILYDAFGSSPGMKQDWGYSALVRYGGKRILFDTGNNPDVFAHNVRAAGVDLRTLDFVVISHRPYGRAQSPGPRESRGEDLRPQGGLRRVRQRTTQHLLPEERFSA